MKKLIKRVFITSFFGIILFTSILCIGIYFDNGTNYDNSGKKNNSANISENIVIDKSSLDSLEPDRLAKMSSAITKSNIANKTEQNNNSANQNQDSCYTIGDTNASDNNICSNVAVEYNDPVYWKWEPNGSVLYLEWADTEAEQKDLEGKGFQRNQLDENGNVPAWFGHNRHTSTVMIGDSFSGKTPTFTKSWFGCSRSEGKSEGMPHTKCIHNLSKLNLSQSRDTSFMFSGIGYKNAYEPGDDKTGYPLLENGVLNISLAEHTDGMFGATKFNCGFSTDASIAINAPKTTTTSCMFQNSFPSSTVFDLSSINFNSISNSSYMFCNCTNVVTILVPQDTDMSNNDVLSTNMFYNCTSIQGTSGTFFDANITDKQYAKVGTGHGIRKQVDGVWIDGDKIDGYFCATIRKAVYSSNASSNGEPSLVFYYDAIGHQTPGDTNSKTYDIPDEIDTLDKIPWEGNINNIIHARFDDSFINYKPKQTAWWFEEARNLVSLNADASGNNSMKNLNCTELKNSDEATTYHGFESMFKHCNKITNMDLTPLNSQPLPDGKTNSTKTNPNLRHTFNDTGLEDIDFTSVNCSGLIDRLDSSVDYWVQGTFQNCKNLKHIAYPPTIRRIGIGCFSGCTSLKKFTCGDNDGNCVLTNVHALAFQGDRVLENYVLKKKQNSQPINYETDNPDLHPFKDTKRIADDTAPLIFSSSVDDTGTKSIAEDVNYSPKKHMYITTFNTDTSGLPKENDKNTDGTYKDYASLENHKYYILTKDVQLSSDDASYNPHYAVGEYKESSENADCVIDFNGYFIIGRTVNTTTGAKTGDAIHVAKATGSSGTVLLRLDDTSNSNLSKVGGITNHHNNLVKTNDFGIIMSYNAPLDFVNCRLINNTSFDGILSCSNTDGKIYMYGGEICNNTVSENGHGAAVCLKKYSVNNESGSLILGHANFHDNYIGTDPQTRKPSGIYTLDNSRVSYIKDPEGKLPVYGSDFIRDVQPKAVFYKSDDASGAKAGDLVFYYDDKDYTGTTVDKDCQFNFEPSTIIIARSGSEKADHAIWAKKLNSTTDLSNQIKRIYANASFKSYNGITSMSQWFRSYNLNDQSADTYKNVTEFNGENFNTSNVTDMSYMFHSIGSGVTTGDKHIIGIGGWDVSNVTTFNNMFAWCYWNKTTTWSLNLKNWWNLKSGEVDVTAMFLRIKHLKTIYSEKNWTNRGTTFKYSSSFTPFYFNTDETTSLVGGAETKPQASGSSTVMSYGPEYFQIDRIDNSTASGAAVNEPGFFTHSQQDPFERPNLAGDHANDIDNKNYILVNLGSYKFTGQSYDYSLKTDDASRAHVLDCPQGEPYRADLGIYQFNNSDAQKWIIKHEACNTAGYTASDSNLYNSLVSVGPVAKTKGTTTTEQRIDRDSYHTYCGQVHNWDNGNNEAQRWIFDKQKTVTGTDETVKVILPGDKIVECCVYQIHAPANYQIGIGVDTIANNSKTRCRLLDTAGDVSKWIAVPVF